MQQIKNTEVQELALELVDDVGEMEVHAIRLKAVQTMIMRLLHEMDDSEGNVSPQVQYYIDNYKATLRVIDLAFYPLMQEVNETVSKLNKGVERLDTHIEGLAQL